MEQNLALEVRFRGETQIYNTGYKTSWQDLIAMLKCSFDTEDIVVYYLDDEEDQIALDTQEEYDEAKRIAVRCQHVMRLRVYNKDERMEVDVPETMETNQSQDQVGAPGINPQSQRSAKTPKATTTSSPPKRPPPPLVKSQSASSFPQQKENSVTGYVKRAVAELKQRKSSKPVNMPDTPAKENELIDQIVKGVLEGLDGCVIEKTRSQSWDPSQGQRSSPIPAPARSYPRGAAESRSSSSPCSPGLALPHNGVTCDNCLRDIVGVRFKCGHCVDFDLCEDCEAMQGTHDPNHVFLKLKRPAYHIGMKSDGRYMPILKHPVYADDDTPVWEYKFKKFEEKMARKAARAELKRKYREEKRRVKMESHGQVSPTKRERIEKMAERQAQQIVAAASVAANPSATTVKVVTTTTETTPLIIRKHDAEFVRDGNLPDETHMQPKTKFVKSWIMINSGNVKWSSDTKLKYLWGDIQVLSSDPVEIPLLCPGEEGPICVDFEAPAEPGHYQSHWRLTHRGEQFGHRVWCNIIVDKAEVLEPLCEKKRTLQEEMLLPKVVESEPVHHESSENTASNAVAHLQSDQADSSTPMRVVSSSDVLTAQDVLSFEMLNINDDQDADKEVDAVNHPAATATPNNTPIVGLTPCISPIPQLDEKLLSRRVSEHSDLEIVQQEDIPLVIETRDVVSDGPKSELPEDGVEVAEPGSENDDEVESIISSSSDGEMLDGFYVVPLPDCFDPSKPIDKSMILSRTSSLTSSMTSSSPYRQPIECSPVIRLPSYEESQSQASSSITSSNSSLVPEVAPAVGPVDLAPSPSPAPEPNTEEPHRGEPEGEVETIGEVTLPTVDALLSTPNTALKTVPLVPLVAATKSQQQATPAATSTTPAQSVTVAPMPEITLLAVPGLASSNAEGGVLINPEGSVLYEAPSHVEVVRDTETVQDTVQQPGVANDGTNVDLIETTVHPQESTQQAENAANRSDATPEERDDEFHDAQDMPDINQQGELNSEFQTDPVELLGYTAARAVEVAGSVVRQAFDTAASSVNALLRPQPIPSPTPYVPPTGQFVPPTEQYVPPAPTPMDQLIEMGFGDRARNRELLEKYNDDVSRCVQDLLPAADNDWHNNRH